MNGVLSLSVKMQLNIWSDVIDYYLLKIQQDFKGLNESDVGNFDESHITFDMSDERMLLFFGEISSNIQSKVLRKFYFQYKCGYQYVQKRKLNQN